MRTARTQKEEIVKEDLKKGQRSSGFKRKGMDKHNVLLTDSRELSNSSANNRKEKSSEASHCPLCKTPHGLDACKQFLKKSVTERREIIRANALCLGCLKWGHMKRNCRKRLVCKT